MLASDSKVDLCIIPFHVNSKSVENFHIPPCNSANSGTGKEAPDCKLEQFPKQHFLKYVAAKEAWQGNECFKYLSKEIIINKKIM